MRDPHGAAMMNGLLLEAVLREASAKSYESVQSTTDPRTPAYVYDLDAMTEAARALMAGFDGESHLVAYAVKANTAGPIIRALG